MSDKGRVVDADNLPAALTDDRSSPGVCCYWWWWWWWSSLLDVEYQDKRR